MNTNLIIYYIRINGRVRGPFSREVLSSMFGRGRINAETPVSEDRTSWSALRDLGEEFAIGVNVSEPPALSTSGMATKQYFCTIDGVTEGPLSIEELQHMIGAGRLQSNDQVWERGQPEWTGAKNIAGLQFPSQPDQARSWIKSQPALFAALATMAILMFGLPTYYVLASAAARRVEKLAQEERLKQEDQLRHEKEAAVRKENLEERRHQELLEQKRMQHEEELARLGAEQTRKAKEEASLERRHQESLQLEREKEAGRKLADQEALQLQRESELARHADAAFAERQRSTQEIKDNIRQKELLNAVRGK